jgi:hypothetical protein
MDDQVRPVEASRTDCQQPREHVVVFAREQAPAGRAAEIHRIRTHALEDRAADHGVPAHQHRVASGAEPLDGLPGFRPADD